MLRRIIRAHLAIIVVLAGAASAGAAEPAALQTAPSALPAVSAPAVVADNSSCAGTCQTLHDQCRVSTKGGPDCDSERQRCVQRCIARKSR